MKNKFLSICIGIGILFLTAGFFVRSITTANAAPVSPKQFIEEGTNKIGKYMITYSLSHGGERRDIAGAFVWNTETGESTYYTLESTNYGPAWEKSKAQIPATK